LLDTGLAEWLLIQRQATLPKGRKLSAYAAQVCEALQWPLYFNLPQSRAVLRADRALWLQWTARLTLSAYRDPEYDYWQVLASRQNNNALQSVWQNFVIEAGRTRFHRYLNLGLLALARLPLSANDSVRNLRLQVQALVQRYIRRESWGSVAEEELAENLRGVRVRNPSLTDDQYRAFLLNMLSPLGENKSDSVLELLGLREANEHRKNARKHPLGSRLFDRRKGSDATSLARAIMSKSSNPYLIQKQMKFYLVNSPIGKRAHLHKPQTLKKIAGYFPSAIYQQSEATRGVSLLRHVYQRLPESKHVEEHHDASPSPSPLLKHAFHFYRRP
jgi:hypothetical protein